MNGYELTAKMRKLRKREPLTSTEQALFNELVAICNEEEWAEEFPCSNSVLCHALQITENSLVKARVTLIRVGLISYKSGKSKRQFSYYSLTTSIFAPNQSTNVIANQSTNVIANDEKKLRTIINNKQKEKPKLKNSKSHSETKVPVIEKIDELLKKPETEIYKELVAIWFDFYRKQFLIKPTFGALDGTKLKSIEKKLKSKCDEFNQDWNEESAGDLFARFLEVAISDKWLRENYQLSILDSKFDSIIVKALKNNNGVTNQTAAANFFTDW